MYFELHVALLWGCMVRPQCEHELRVMELYAVIIAFFVDFVTFVHVKSACNNHTFYRDDHHCQLLNLMHGLATPNILFINLETVVMKGQNLCINTSKSISYFIY